MKTKASISMPFVIGTIVNLVVLGQVVLLGFVNVHPHAGSSNIRRNMEAVVPCPRQLKSSESDDLQQVKKELNNKIQELEEMKEKLTKFDKSTKFDNEQEATSKTKAKIELLASTLDETLGKESLNQKETKNTLKNKSKAKLAIAIVSAFDWEARSPYVSARDRRQLHRDTWMTHPAVMSGLVRAYFIIGNKQHKFQKHGNYKTQNLTVRDISELQAEMEHYNDIVLLGGNDWHNEGKMNAWYEWASSLSQVNMTHSNVSAVDADYHMKLDDEDYVIVDNLLKNLDNVARNEPKGFLGGTGDTVNQNYGKDQKGNPIKLRQITRLKGWGYIMSKDVLQDLGDCSREGRLPWNKGMDEDTYHGVALRLCGLDRTGKNMGISKLNVAKRMYMYSLRHILALGCPFYVNRAAVIHCGMRSGGHKVGKSTNPFSKVAVQTFQTLHTIYNHRPADPLPTWMTWESLRLLYMEDLGACDGSHSKEAACIVQEKYQNRTCVRIAHK